MAVSQSNRPACPCCRTRLRLADDVRSGTPLSCPECGAALKLVSGEDGYHELWETGDTAASQPPGQIRRFLSEVAKTAGTLPPRTVAGVVVGLLGAILAAAALWSSRGAASDALPAVSSDSTSVHGGLSDEAGRLSVAGESSSSLTAPRDGTVERRQPEGRRTDGALSGGTMRPDETESAEPALPSGTQFRDVAAATMPVPQPDSPPVGSATGASDNVVAGTGPLSDSGQPLVDQPVARPDSAEKQPTAPAEVQPKIPVASTRRPLKERLRVEFQTFQQSEPVAVIRIVEQVEDMAGVRIDVSQATSAALETRVAFVLTPAMPLTILREAADRAGLRVIEDDQAVHLVPGSERP